MELRVRCHAQRKEARVAKNFRNAITGRFVTSAYAKKHPNTTVTETRNTDRKKKQQ
jgi:hypothetical protein